MNEFLKTKNIEFPRNVIAGHDVLSQIKDVCDDLHVGKKGTIITGKKTYAAAGKDVESFLDGYDIDICFTGEATLENITEAESSIKQTKPNFIVAVGGGSKIDTAKVVSNELNIPFISVPTSAAHDGIASNRASIHSENGSKSVESASPMGIIADTAIINKAPFKLLASGCADVISNLTALEDWDFARRLRNESFSRSAFFVSKFAAENIIDGCELIKPNLEESVWIAIKPIILSGISMCMAGSSRPTSGAEHMFSHTIDVNFPGRALHGEQCGVGSILTMYLHGGDWEMIRDSLMKIGCPTTAKELNLADDELIFALSHAHEIRSDRFTILGDKGIGPDVAEKVASATGVI